MPDSKETTPEVNTTSNEMHMPGQQTAHTGPILAVLVIMLILILGGLYLWGGMLSNEVSMPDTAIINNEPETPRAEADQEILGTVSPSDELDAIEADIDSTNLDSLQSDMVAIEAELNARPQ